MGRAVAALEPGGRPVRAPCVSRGTRAPRETDRCTTRPLFCCLPRLRDVRDRDRVRRDSRQVERIADPGQGRGGRPPCYGRPDVADRDGPVVGPDGTPGHRRTPRRKPVSLPCPETLLTGRARTRDAAGESSWEHRRSAKRGVGIGFRYTGIPVRGLDRSLAFYTKGLGVQGTWRLPIRGTGGAIAGPKTPPGSP